MKSYGKSLKIKYRRGEIEKMLQKTKVKEIFSKHKIQLPSDSLDFLDSEVNRMVHKWVLRCKNGNIKRLSMDLVGYVLPNTVDSVNKDGFNPILANKLRSKK
jgi:hypothetical protein